MVIHSEGEKSRAVCERCRGVVTTTFRYAPFRVNGARIPDVLQGFCDQCGDAVSLPHQSTFRIREYRQTHSRSVDVRVPRHHIDILLAIGGVHHVSAKPNLLCRLLSELYLPRMCGPAGRATRRRVMGALKQGLARGRCRGRLSYGLPESAYAALRSLSAEEGGAPSDIVRGIIVTAKQDLLDTRRSTVRREFEKMVTCRS